MNFENFDAGIAITAVTALLFYFRIAMLRGKKRRLAKEAALEQMRKAQNKKKRVKVNEPSYAKPSIEVSSWALVVVAIVLMLIGIVAKNSPGFPVPETLKATWTVVQTYWWVGPSLGFILFMFGFK